ncbi:MAG: glycosyltransferase, partial [Pseudonocardiaceae bacterium]
LPVSRKRRALVAAGYALLPPAIAGLAQGRLDVVVTFILLPLVLAGIAVVLSGGRASGSAAWLSTAAATAVGLAVISAFAPLVHLLILAVVLLGFVLVPAPNGTALRRVAGLFAVVLAPLGMLMPWPAVVVQRPAVLLHGVGAVVPESSPGWLRLIAMDPGGAGAVPWVGLVVAAAAVIAIIVRPTWAMLPGLGLVLLGAGAVAVLTTFSVAPLAGGDPRPGFTGGALLLVGCGLLWIALLAGRSTARAPRNSGIAGKAIAAMPWLGVGALSVVAVLVGSAGPLTDEMPAGQPVLAAALSDELARDGTSVLVVGDEGEPVRLTRSRTARFGDDDIAPLRATGSRLERVAAALRDGKPGETPAAIANVAATGVEFVVLPTAEQGARALAAAGSLAQSAPPTADGRPVLRVVRPIPGAELLGPALAEQARSGAAPPIDKGVTGVLVEGGPPSVAVQVEAGAQDRLLVVAANDEPGWQATIDGAAVPVVRGWGHQVAVLVPATSAEVRVDRSELARALLLLGQAAMVLLIVGMAVPSWRSARHNREHSG